MAELMIEDRGIILDASQLAPNERIAFFTSLCRLQSGRILCGFHIGPKKHAVTSTIGLCHSVDQGQSWHRWPTSFATEISGVPGSLSTAEMVESRPGLLLLFATWFDRSDPERPLFDPVTEGILRSKQLLSVSTDDGRTWSDWRELPVEGLRGCAITGPVVRWDDGTIAFAFESFKEFDDPRPGRHAAWLMLSHDGGESFSSPLLVAQHPEHTVYYWDQRLCVGPQPGRWTALFWTHHLAEQRDLNVHLRHGTVEKSAAGDRLNLQPIQGTSIPGQIAAPLWLNDRRLLAFVVDRDQPGTMSLWCSSDGGHSWPVEDRLIVHTHNERAVLSQGKENVDFKQYWEDMGKWSFGHPAIQILRDNQVLLAWYAGTPDCMSLHWARVRTNEGMG